jgi:APA family basic amino acid/polyamine antiporter
VPRGVLGALAVAVVIYIAVAFVVVGLVDYNQLDVSDPLSVAVGAVSELEWLQALIDFSAVAFLAATVLATLYGMTRVVMRSGEDGMVPQRLARVDPRRGTPTFTTILIGIVAASLSGLLPIDVLADLVSVGTLSAFLVVAIAVLALRRARPDLERPIRLPFGPLIPLATIVVTIGVAAMLPAVTLLRLAIWVAIGLAVFLLYSRTRSRKVIDARIGETG